MYHGGYANRIARKNWKEIIRHLKNKRDLPMLTSIKPIRSIEPDCFDRMDVGNEVGRDQDNQHGNENSAHIDE